MLEEHDAANMSTSEHVLVIMSSSHLPREHPTTLHDCSIKKFVEMTAVLSPYEHFHPAVSIWATIVRPDNDAPASAQASVTIFTWSGDKGKAKT